MDEETLDARVPAMELVVTAAVDPLSPFEGAAVGRLSTLVVVGTSVGGPVVVADPRPRLSSVVVEDAAADDGVSS